MPAPDSVYSCCLATRQSDDDEAFALARIQPFQLRCRGTASAGAAVLVTKEARPGSWWLRGEGAPPPSCLGVSGLRGPLTDASVPAYAIEACRLLVIMCFDMLCIVAVFTMLQSVSQTPGRPASRE